jgi:hypothetical protein
LSIPGLGRPQGVAVAVSNHLAVVACGSDGVIHAYDTRTLAEKGRCQVGKDADNVRFANGYFLIGYGSKTAGGIATVDLATLSKVSDLFWPSEKYCGLPCRIRFDSADRRADKPLGSGPMLWGKSQAALPNCKRGSLSSIVFKLGQSTPFI